MKALLRTQIEAEVARLEQRAQTFTRQLGDFVGIEVLNQRGQFAFLRSLVNYDTGGLLASHKRRSSLTTRLLIRQSWPNAIICVLAIISSEY
jgi:type IV secretion system protein VirB4